MHLRLNLRTELEHFDFPVQQDRQQLKTLLKTRKRKDFQFFRIGYIDRIRDQINDAGIVLKIQHRDLELFRKIRRIRNDLLKLPDGIFRHRGNFHIVIVRFRKTFDFGGVVLRMKSEKPDPGEPADQNPVGLVGELDVFHNTPRNADHGEFFLIHGKGVHIDLRNSVLILRRDLREQSDQFIRSVCDPRDQLNGRFPVDHQRRQRIRKHKCSAQRKRRDVHFFR